MKPIARNMPSTDISVIVPVFNNEHSLKELTERIHTHLEENQILYEIIYINDASEDLSQNVIEQLSSRHTFVKYIHFTENIGQHRAILKGFAMAMGEHIVVMDADLQDQPELIGKLLQSLSAENEAVFVKRKGIYQSGLRMLTSYLTKSVVRSIIGLHQKAGSYFLIHRSIMEKVVELGKQCPYPYVSILVGSSASGLQYIMAERYKSIRKSGYSFAKRLFAAYKAIYCAMWCRRTKNKLSKQLTG